MIHIIDFINNRANNKSHYLLCIFQVPDTLYTLSHLFLTPCQQGKLFSPIYMIELIFKEVNNYPKPTQEVSTGTWIQIHTTGPQSPSS